MPLTISALALRSSRRWASTPLARQVLDQAQRSLAQFVAEADRRRAEKLLEPRRWALFHARMAETLPVWRGAARAHHRRVARRFRAHVWAEEHMPCSP